MSYYFLHFYFLQFQSLHFVVDRRRVCGGVINVKCVVAAVFLVILGRLIKRGILNRGLESPSQPRLDRRETRAERRVFFRRIRRWALSSEPRPDAFLHLHAVLVLLGQRLGVRRVRLQVGHVFGRLGRLVAERARHGHARALAERLVSRQVVRGYPERAVSAQLGALRAEVFVVTHVGLGALEPAAAVLAGGGHRPAGPDVGVRVGVLADGRGAVGAGQGQAVRGHAIHVLAQERVGKYVDGARVPAVARGRHGRIAREALDQALGLSGRDEIVQAFIARGQGGRIAAAPKARQVARRKGHLLAHEAAQAAFFFSFDVH